MTIPTNETIEKAKKGVAERRAPTATASRGSVDFTLDMRRYLAHYGMEILRIKPKGGVTYFEVKNCPFNPDHNSGSAVFSISADGIPGFKCHHNSCVDNHWSEARQKLSGDDPLLPFSMTPLKQYKQAKNSEITVTIEDVREYLENEVPTGGFFEPKNVSDHLCARDRASRHYISKCLRRIEEEGLIKRPKHAKRGIWQKIAKLKMTDIWSEDIKEVEYDLIMPLCLERIITPHENKLFLVIGDKSAGKSWFMLNIAAENKNKYPVIYFHTAELDNVDLRKRCTSLGIDRNDNIVFYPFEPGFEDMIPKGQCIVLVDYIRLGEVVYNLDAELYNVLENLKGGIAFIGVQKHPFRDRPNGGQFSYHAVEHAIILDNTRSDEPTLRIFNSKDGDHLRGQNRTYIIPKGTSQEGRFVPTSPGYVSGNLFFAKNKILKGYSKIGDIGDIGDKNDVPKGGGLYKNKKEKEKKERAKERKEKEKTVLDSKDRAHGNDSKIISKNVPSGQSNAQGQERFEL
jgi:hypothetical protein